MLSVLDFLVHENMVILAFAVLVPLVVLLRRSIRAHAVLYYLVITVFTFIVSGLWIHWSLTDSYPVDEWWWPFMNQMKRGSVGFVFFTIVMFQGVIKPWNKVTRELYAIRGEISIFACITSFCHLLLYGLSWIIDHGDAEVPYDILFWTSLLLLIVGIPLFITSFKKIRFSMKAANWQKLHKASYFFYFLLYANVIFVFIRRFLVFSDRLYEPENLPWLIDTYVSLVIYSALFVAYTVLRIRTDRNKRERARVRELKRKAHEEGRSLEAID
ncbi:hypothetical protein ACN08X_00555 [Rothia sp. P6271]|uniref:hypothetical protein n=1 Tax=Rothia sp. P6271 TaxID=3402659 RepID=UPI003ACB6709